MQTENAVLFHNMHDNPPNIVAHIGDRRFKILMSGKTYLVLDGIMFEAPGCPIPPDVLLIAQFTAWLTRNRNWWPIIPIVVIAFAVATGMLLSMPESAEVSLWFVSTLSKIMTTVLLALVAMVFVATGLYYFGGGLYILVRNGIIKYKEDTTDSKLLTTGEISLSPDTLIFSEHEFEPTEDFAIRLESARRAQKPGEWVVSIPFGHPSGVIIFSAEPDEETSQGVFRRDSPPYETKDWADEQRTAAYGTRFERESFTQYMSYLNKFSMNFKEWSKHQKLTVGDPAKAMADTLRRMSTMSVFVLLFLSGLSAQKDAQVIKYLGMDRYETVKPVGEVKFIFEKAVLKRVGDGNVPYKRLLTDASSYTNEDNAGHLVGIRVAGSMILPESPTATKPTKVAASVEQTAIPTMPSADGSGNSFWSSMPDTNELEKIKADFIKGKQKFGAELAPRKNFLLWMYWNAIAPIMLLVGFLAYFIAKLAFKESMHDRYGNTIFGMDISQWGHYARYVVFCVIVVNVMVFMIDMFITDYFSQVSMWWWVVKCFLLTIIAYFISSWLVPNPKVANNGNMQHAINAPRLNG